jgi:hypothetical protein
MVMHGVELPAASALNHRILGDAVRDVSKIILPPLHLR